MYLESRWRALIQCRLKHTENHATSSCPRTKAQYEPYVKPNAVISNNNEKKKPSLTRTIQKYILIT
jgi:hypothetical protein